MFLSEAADEAAPGPTGTSDELPLSFSSKRRPERRLQQDSRNRSRHHTGRTEKELGRVEQRAHEQHELPGVQEFEVDKIVGHFRRRRRKYIYRVKWKHTDLITEQDEADFVTKEILHEDWNDQNIPPTLKPVKYRIA